MVAVLTTENEQITYLAPSCDDPSSLTPVAGLIALADALDLELDALIAHVEQLRRKWQLPGPAADGSRSALPDRVDGPSPAGRGEPTAKPRPHCG